MKIKSFLVVSRFKENVEWVHNYTNEYVIYNKGEDLPDDFKQLKQPNFGGNQYDIFHFIYENYYNLPDLIAFCQGNPFDHCSEIDFNRLIYNEYYTNLFSTHAGENFQSGIFFEANDNFYLKCSNACKVSSFDEFASSIFENYLPIRILSFPPGSQFIVEKERCLYYSRAFWKNLMKFINTDIGLNGGRESHVVERAMQLIFETRYKEKFISS